MASKTTKSAWHQQPDKPTTGRRLIFVRPSSTVREEEKEEKKKEEKEEKKGEEKKEKEEKEEQKGRKPFFLIRWITTRPRLFFGVTLGAHLFFLVLSGILYASGYSILSDNWQVIPLELHDEPWLKREYAWTERDDYPNRVTRDLPQDKHPTWDRAFTREQVLLFYDAGDGNVFSRERLQAMQVIEQRLARIPEYSSHCQLTQSGTCTPFVSVLRFFDGSYASVNAVFNDSTFDNIDSVLYAAYTTPETNGAFMYALGKNNDISSGSVSSTLTRTIVPLGWPLSAHDNDDAMLTALDDFMEDCMEPVLSDFEDRPEFEFSYYNYRLMSRMAKQQAGPDGALAAAAMLFIFLFMWVHVGSLMVTALAVMSIVCSFVETNFVYRVILDYRYFGYFHLLAMFIILGIGADDVFVFWHAWRATGWRRYPSLAHRLNDAYCRASTSMLVTSLTTMAAFLATALSPLLATNSFGVFSAVLVMINYVSVVTFFPGVVIFYHLHYEDKPHPCCCCWEKDRDEDKPHPCCCCWNKDRDEDKPHPLCCCRDKDRDEDGGGESHHSTESGSYPQMSTASHRHQNSPTQHFKHDPYSGAETTAGGSSKQQADGVVEDSKPQEKGDRMVVFFRDHFFAVVTHRVVRWVMVLALLGCVAGFTFSAIHLQPDNEEIKFFRDFVAYTKAAHHNNYGFVPTPLDPTTTIYLVWGLQENDLSGCHFSSIECQGQHDHDDSFRASTAAAQQSFVRVCDTLFAFTDDQTSDYAIRLDVATGEPEIACFPRAMTTFLQSDPALGGVDVTMPWNWTKTSDFMTTLNAYYNTEDFDSNFQQQLDIPMTYWIWDRFNQSNHVDYQLYNSLFGEETDTYSSAVLTDPSITTGNRLKYLAISANTTLSPRSLGYTEGIPIVERWEKFMEDQMATMPPEMQSGFQTTVFSWHWLYVQRTVSQNAVQGMALGLALTFPVLLVATGNLLIGLLATMAIACITACVIGLIPLAGWKLGVLVSFNMSLVVGLAVDFVVHLAEGYHQSQRADREGRLQDALGSMGSSVFAGACTTLGASLVMLFARIQFFFQFGIFMISTIGFSFVFAMGLFVPIMGILGPQGDTGDLRVIFSKVKAACCARKNKISPPPKS